MSNVSPDEATGASPAPFLVQFNSFRSSLEKFEGGKLLASATLFDRMSVTFNKSEGASVEVKKLTSPEGQDYLCLQSQQMERSNWFALEVALPLASLTPGSVVVVATDANCPQGMTSFAVVRLRDQNGESLDNASMEINLNAVRATRTYPIEISETFLKGLKSLKEARAILFFECRSALINMFDIQVHAFNLRGVAQPAAPKPLSEAPPPPPQEARPKPPAPAPVREAIPIMPLQGLLETIVPRTIRAPTPLSPVARTIAVAATKEPSAPAASTDGPAKWALPPFTQTELIGHSLPITRNVDFEPGLRLVFPPTDQQPTVRVAKVNGQYVRHINLTSIALLPWRSLEFHLDGLAKATAGTLTLRAAASTPMKLTPLLLIQNGGERLEFRVFQPISLTKELTTYSQTGALQELQAALTPASICRLALILGGVCDDFAIETLELSLK